MGLRTIQRYERERELPIRRPAGGPKGAVMATRKELDEWITRRPKRMLRAVSAPSPVIANATWAALQAEMLRMAELKRQVAQSRDEMRAALNLLRGSIRFVDTPSFESLDNIQVSNSASRKRLKRIELSEGTRAKAI